MATFALIHGGGGTAWDWHLIVPELLERGHESIAVDLPTEEESAGWWAYADAVVDAVRERQPVTVVGHSLGGFTAPLVCVRISVDLLVLVAAMIPSAGERVDEWWTNAGYEDSGFDDVFYHDVPPKLAAEAQRRERDEQAKALREPWPLDAWPQTPTRYLLCRDDRMFTAGWARRHARERLASRPTRWTAATKSPSAGRASWHNGSTHTPPASGTHATSRRRCDSLPASAQPVSDATRAALLHRTTSGAIAAHGER